MANAGTPYSGSEPYVFVCYSHENQKSVEAEIAWLQENGVNVWHDDGIAAGTPWRKEIAEALSGATQVFYFVSAASATSEHCLREIHFALEQQIPLLPIYLEPTELPAEQALAISRIQALDVADVRYRERLAATVQEVIQSADLNVEIEVELPRWQPATSRWISAAAILLGLAGAAYLFAVEWRTGEPPEELDFLQSVAVSPLSIPDGSGLQEFATVARQDLLNSFSEADQLRIVDDVNSADLLLEGSVHALGSEIVLSFQYQRTDQGDVLWADAIHQAAEEKKFRKSQFVARLVESIAGAHNWSRTFDSTLEAQDAFRLGMTEWQKSVMGAGGDARVAERYFRRSLSIDPDLVMAYGMLTTLYSNRLGWRMTAEVAGEKAHEAIQQGLARSPEVTFFLGKLNMDIDLDYARAEANLREAEAQEPDNPTFLLNLGILSLLRGELNNAMNHLETAIGISASFDNGWARYHLGMAYMLAGMNTKALDQFEIARDSSIQEPPFNLIARCEVTYRVLGKAAADRCTDEGWLIYGEDRPDWLPGLFALTGRQAEARTILDDMERESAARDLALNSMAFEAYLHMGKMEDAYRWMGRAIENREPWMIMRLKSDQSLAPIREDVEFKNALARLAQIEAQGSPTRSAAMQ